MKITTILFLIPMLFGASCAAKAKMVIAPPPPPNPAVEAKIKKQNQNDNYVKALELAHRGSYEQALAKLTSILAEEGNFAEAYWARGEIYYSLKKTDLALKNYQSALQYAPKMSAAYLQSARIYFERKEYEKAKEQLQGILNLDARQPQALEMTRQIREEAARFYLKQGQEFARANQTSKAVSALSDALKENDNLYEAWLELGRIKQVKGENAQAIKDYEKALIIKNDLPLVWKELGKLYILTSSPQLAKLALQRSLKLDPNQKEVHQLLEQLKTNGKSQNNLPQEYLKISSNPALTRGELAAVLAVNLREINENDNQAPPVIINDIGNHWAQSYIIYAVKQDWMQPYPNHSFLPQETVSRGEMAEILDAIITDKMGAAANFFEPAFADVAPENKFYPAIMRLNKLGLFNNLPNGNFSPEKPAGGQEALEITEKIKNLLSD